jgi:hypothetical protein
MVGRREVEPRVGRLLDGRAAVELRPVVRRGGLHSAALAPNQRLARRFTSVVVRARSFPSTT